MMNSLSIMFMFVMMMVFAIGYIQMPPVEGCGPNETEVDCAPLQSCQPSCNEPNGTTCPRTCDVSACVCKEGFVRDNNNNFQCIDPKQCSIPTTTTSAAPSSMCGLNEVQSDCALPLICQPRCDNANGDVCPLICSPNSCQCKEGFIRRSQYDFTCVDPKQCSISKTTFLPAPLLSPTPSSTCDTNEVGSECALPLTCQPTCDNSNGTDCPVICGSNSCQCKEGFIRHSQLDLACIAKTKCSITATTPPPLCGLNEVGSQCGQPPSCQPTCDNPNGTACASICNPNSCICKEGFIRQSQYDLTCVDQTQCNQVKPLTCGENEVNDQCMNPCQPSCEEPDRKSCPTVRCAEGCVCRQGYLRATNVMGSLCVICQKSTTTNPNSVDNK